MRRRFRILRPVTEQLDERCLLSGDFITLMPPGGLTPAQLTTAYGLNDISLQTAGGTVSGNGAGQTIALIEAYHDPTIWSDLHTFDATYGLPDTGFWQINLAGGQSNPGWALEESLDVEWAHAIAPAASIVVVEAASQTRMNLLQAVDVARNISSVSVISMSWGFSEIAYEGSSHFQTPAGHQGITFLAASGDSGTAAGAEWPAVSPYVVSVGGTSLNTDAYGNYQYETAWVDSGGGFSQYLGEPGYQRSLQNTGRRATPDVSLVGDPNTGVEVYETTGGFGSWEVVGGTSLATPAWGAILAIADQGRVLQGGTTLNGATQTLPTLYDLSSSDFHQIVGAVNSGGNALVVGVNVQTGLGSPVGSAIIESLVASQVYVPLTTSRAVGVSSARHQVAKVKNHKLVQIKTVLNREQSNATLGRPVLLDGLRTGETVLSMLAATIKQKTMGFARS